LAAYQDSAFLHCFLFFFLFSHGALASPTLLVCTFDIFPFFLRKYPDNLSSQRRLRFCDGRRRVLCATVKLGNTLEYQCRTGIYLVAVPCSGMKKRLLSYFAAATLLIISTGTARTKTLSKWLPHRKKAAAGKIN
jgi:hypothetical protein